MISGARLAEGYSGFHSGQPGIEEAAPAREDRSIVALDLVRGLAALLVVLVHVRQTAFSTTSLPPDVRGVTTALFYGLTRSGNEAVLVFFVLSGLLVGGQIVSRVKAGRFDWTIYTVDRLSRIFLPLIPAVFISAAIGAVFLGHSPGTPEMLANAFGLNGVLTQTMIENWPLWSLAYEIWFYVIGGSLAYILCEGLIWFPYSFCRWHVQHGRTGHPLLPDLGFGSSRIPVRMLRRRELLFVVGILLIGIGAFLNQLTVPTKIFEHVPPLRGIDGASLLSIGLCLMMRILCSDETARRLRALRRPAAALASFSYSLYLFHFPINEALQLWMPQAGTITLLTASQFVLRVALCVLGSLAFYWCFERNTGTVRQTLTRYFHLDKRVAA